MDDIFREIKESRYDSKMTEINSLHESLKFTGKIEKGKSPKYFKIFVKKHNI